MTHAGPTRPSSSPRVATVIRGSAQRPAYAGRVARRILAISGGVLLIIVGLAAGAAALVAYGLFGTTETVTLPAGRITSSSQASAIVLDVDRWDTALPVVAGDRHVAAVFRSVDGGPLFAGLGTRSDIDAYLLGTPTTIAERDGDRWLTVDVPGAQLPGPPQLAPVWIRSGTGSQAQVWVDGVLPATITVMRPTPSAGLDVLVDVRTMIPGVSRVIAGLAIIAAALVSLGIVLIVIGARHRAAQSPPGRDAAPRTIAPTPGPRTVDASEGPTP